jgi:aldehyde:ferredoxin oxidoreductase
MKFLRVDMSQKTVSVEDVKGEYVGLGGRGLTSIMINNEVPADCDPLGPDNKLIFAPGILSGTTAVNTSRISIGAKSPLTGGIKEANVGGTVPAALGRLGIAAIIVDGQAADGLFMLKIDASGEASLVPGDEYKGMRTYAFVEKMLDTYGEKNGVLCIGPAGEFQLGSASVQTSDVDGHPCRAAGRGGMGAVMGAKGLKAVIVDLGAKSAQVISDPDAFKEASKAIVKAIKENMFTGTILPNVGTAAMLGMVNGMGAFPTRNATAGQFEGADKISGEKMAETITARGGKTTHVGCSQCIVQCSNEYVDKDGKFVTGSLEYETLWSMGGMLGIDDLDAVARLDFLADDIGLDSINAGVAIGVAMDAGYKSFGDSQAAIDMMEEIAQGTEMGKILGNGPVAVGKHFNHHRVPAVKGQSIAAYDPRGMQGNGVTYATSPMGADHTAGNIVGHYLGGALNPTEAEGQVDASRTTQISMAAIDCTGFCLLAGSALAEPGAMEAFIGLLNAKLGTQMGVEDYDNMGIATLKAEKEFNLKAGLTKEDDRLPKFFYEEPLSPHNVVFVVTDEDLDSTLEF